MPGTDCLRWRLSALAIGISWFGKLSKPVLTFFPETQYCMLLKQKLNEKVERQQRLFPCSWWENVDFILLLQQRSYSIL